jgi:hypothetical protein
MKKRHGNVVQVVESLNIRPCGQFPVLPKKEGVVDKTDSLKIAISWKERNKLQEKHFTTDEEHFFSII